MILRRSGLEFFIMIEKKCSTVYSKYYIVVHMWVSCVIISGVRLQTSRSSQSPS